MAKKITLAVLLLVWLILGCRSLSWTGSEPGQENGDSSAQVNNDFQDGSLQDKRSSSGYPLATPYAQSPAAGICAQFEGVWVTVTINPDISDPRCAAIRPDQMLEVVNRREETLTVKIGYMEVELAPGESHKYEAAFGDYLAPGVHVIDVQPCCGAELVLTSGQ